MKRILIILALFCWAPPLLLTPAFAAFINWDGSEGTSWADGNNWAGDSVPGPTDTAGFDDNTSSNSCVIDTTVGVEGITLDNYTGTLDFGDTAEEVSIGAAGFLVDKGTIDLGDAVITITDGDFDFLQPSGGSWTTGTGSVNLAGTCTVTGDSGKRLYKFATASGSAISIAAATDRHFDILNEADIDGTVTVAAAGDALRINAVANLLVRAGAVINGPGSIEFNYPTAGYGLTTLETGATLNVPIRVSASSGTPLAAGIYGGNTYGLVILQRVIANPATVSLAGGDYEFNQGLTFYTSSTGSLTVDTHTNGTDEIQVSDLTFSKSSTGVIAVSSASQLCDLIITGDVVDSGAATWAKGTGSITANSIAKLGGSFEFNGLSDEVDINAQLHNFATDFTISAWIRLPTVTSLANRKIFTQESNCQFFVHTTGALRYVTGGGTTSTGTGVFTAGTWHLVMVMYDDSGTDVVKLYVDNIEEKSHDRTAANTAADSRIGSLNGNSTWFAGWIDDVRIWDKALSTAERAALYNSGNGTTDAVASGNCLAWYKFDDFLGDTVVIDSSGNGNTGTATQNTNVLSATPKDWDWGSVTGTLEDLIVDTTAGTLTLSGGWTSDSFTFTDGSLNVGGQTVVTTGNFSVAPGCTFATGGAGLNTADITVGGNFTVTGTAATAIDMTASAWTLDITGSGQAQWVNVTNSDASAGSSVHAQRSTNGGSNTNWIFHRGGGRGSFHGGAPIPRMRIR